MKELGEVIRELNAAGFSGWTVILAIFGLTAIWRGPAYFKSIATFFNEKRRVNGDLSRKLERLHLGIDEKRRKLAAKKENTAEKAKKKAIGRRS